MDSLAEPCNAVNSNLSDVLHGRDRKGAGLLRSGNLDRIVNRQAIIDLADFVQLSDERLRKLLQVKTRNMAAQRQHAGIVGAGGFAEDAVAAGSQPAGRPGDDLAWERGGSDGPPRKLRAGALPQPRGNALPQAAGE